MTRFDAWCLKGRRMQQWQTMSSLTVRLLVVAFVIFIGVVMNVTRAVYNLAAQELRLYDGESLYAEVPCPVECDADHYLSMIAPDVPLEVETTTTFGLLKSFGTSPHFPYYPV